MSTAEEKKRIDPKLCVICQQSLGRHSMKVKMGRKVRRICNRVDEDHANWLLDHKMDVNYLRITGKRRPGIMGIVILMMAFVALIWAFVYTTQAEPLFMVAAAALSVLIGMFVMAEFRILTVSDRMRSILRDVEMERPIVSTEPHPALDRLDEMAALAGEAEPERGRVAIHPPAEPAPTSASAPRPSLHTEDGIPGVPQPVVSANEWQVMAVDGPSPGAPAPAPGTPPPPVPPPPSIEDLPDETAPAPAAPPTAPPTAPPAAPPTAPPAAPPTAPPTAPPAAPPTAPPAAPPTAPPAAPPTATPQVAPAPPQPPVQPPPTPPQPPVQPSPTPPQPPVQAPPTPLQPPFQAPPAPPQPPVQAPPTPPQPPAQAPPAPPQPPAQAPPAPPQPPVQAPPAPPQPPAQAPPAPPQPPAQAPPVYPQPPAQAPPVPPKRPPVEEEDVEEADWVDWE